MIWIDADGCPVTQLAIGLAKKWGLDVCIVKNHAVHIDSDYAQVVTVDISRDAADFYIVNHLSKNDLVVTSDYGLSALVLARGGSIITPMGKQVTYDNIDFLLEKRLTDRKARKEGVRTKGFKKRTHQDNEVFASAFTHMLKQITE